MKRFKRNWSWLSLQSENVRDKEGMFCIEMKSKGCVCVGGGGCQTQPVRLLCLSTTQRLRCLTERASNRGDRCVCLPSVHRIVVMMIHRKPFSKEVAFDFRRVWASEFSWTSSNHNTEFSPLSLVEFKR